MDAQAIVIGAGYAGLSAAETLRRQGKDVLVLEARGRVGGRTRTDHLDNGLWLDLGGQWLGPGQDHLYALAQRFEKRVWAMHTAGHNLVHLKGRNRRYRGLIPFRLPPLALLNLGWGFWRLEALAKRVPLDNPGHAVRAKHLDQQTLGDWLRRNLRHPQARALMQVAIESVFAAHPDDISLLHALFYLRSGGGLERLTSARGGAQQDRIDGGMQGLAESWRQSLEAEDVSFAMESPVHAIEQDRLGTTIHTSAGKLTADRVICTLPPALTLDVDFRPGMPEARRVWCRGLKPGQVIKCFAIYPRPFWRDQGLSGSAAGDRPPVHACFDATPPDSPKGILMGFIEAREAVHWAEQSQASRRQVVLGAFERYFGEQALAPEHYVDHVWATETWSRGCYAGVAAPGVISETGTSARIPHHRIHWAGTETATHWNGYIEGAIRSGIRAAEETDNT